MKKLFLIVLNINIVIQLVPLSLYSQNNEYIKEKSKSNLSETYSFIKCGLQYVKGSVLLGKRMINFYGIEQPASINITGLPADAKIEKAFAWWDIDGNDTVFSITVENPDNISKTFAGKLIGKGNMCWGEQSAYRADVTSIIRGNGIYKISGLPTDTTGNGNDATGVTLFIIYSDNSIEDVGIIKIYDGFKKVYYTTTTQTLNNLRIKNTVPAKAFMIISDLENITYPGVSKISMNNCSYYTFQQNFWDYIERNTAVIEGQDSCMYGIQAPYDCAHLIMAGLYHQIPHDSLTITITQSNDTLYATQGYYFYQWYRNGSAITNANKYYYRTQLKGNYYVQVKDSFNCEKTSETYLFNGISTITTQAIFEIYPNPANDFITITYSDIKNNQAVLSIIDITGHTIQDIKIEKDNQIIDIHKFSKGIYLVRLNSNQYSIYKKLIIE